MRFLRICFSFGDKNNGPFVHSQNAIQFDLPEPTKFKTGIRSLFHPCVNAMEGRSYVGCHIWRWVIVPSDFARSFITICTHSRNGVFHCVIPIMCVWFSPRRKGNLGLLGGLRLWKKNGGTITLLHTWPQDGCRNRFPS